MHNEKLIEKNTSLYRHQFDNVHEIAAIDLGSNSFHMIIARIVNGNIQILSRLKQKVQLAKGLDENNRLDQDAITRGVKCLALFAERLQGFAPENVRVVGTYTLRSAVNNQEFLEQAAQFFPYPINIISGETEARTIYAGVSHTQPEQGRKLVVDIGGGSTEMIIGDDFDPIFANSRNMGCVSFAEKFFRNGEINALCFEQARQAAFECIADLAQSYKKLGWKYVLGSSGTIKTVYQVITATIDVDGVITAGRLDFLIERVLKFTHFDELKIAGLTDDHADVFVPGLAILSAVFDTFEISQMRYSDGALREGVIYGLDKRFLVKNIRQRTAEGLIEQFNIDRQQADRVSQTAVDLAQQFHEWQATDAENEMKEVLYWAAWLHEVGIVVNYKNVQKHSAYILSNMELPGFNREQQRLLATLIRYHIASFNYHDIGQFSRYSPQDVLTLIRLLRLAVLLNKPRQATQKSQIQLKTDHTLWFLIFEQDYLNHNPLIQNELKAEQKALIEIGLDLNFSS